MPLILCRKIPGQQAAYKVGIEEFDLNHGSVAVIKSFNLPLELEEQVLSCDIFSAVTVLRRGGYLKAYSRWSNIRQPKMRLYKLDMESLALTWSASDDRVYLYPLEHLSKIVPGIQSSFFENGKTRERQLGIELVWSKGLGTLRLVCSNQRDWCLWMRGLTYGRQKAAIRKKRTSTANGSCSKQIWDDHVKEYANFGDVLEMMKALGISADVRYLALIFQHTDEDGSQSIGYGQFLDCVNWFTSTYDISKESGLDLTGPSSFETYKEFLRDVQLEPDIECERFIKQLSQTWTTAPLLDNGHLTSYALYMLTKTAGFNGILDPSRAAYDEDVMTRSLQSYWIKSVLYPFHQGFRGSMTNILRRHLHQGVRCLGLCVDETSGSVAQPMIRPEAGSKEGLSVTQFIQLVKKHGFTTTQEALILAIIPACHGSALKALVDELVQGFGPMLYIHSNMSGCKDGRYLPSPKELRSRIVIASSYWKSHCYSTGIEQHNIACKVMNLASRTDRGLEKEAALKLLSIPPMKHKRSDFYETSEREDVAAANALSDITSLLLTYADVGDVYPNAQCLVIKANELSRFDDVHAANLYLSSRFGITYPIGAYSLGIRCNHHRNATAYAQGCQLVDESTTISSMGQAIFQENGRCGYVPKPIIDHGRVLEVPTMIEFHILSGHQLPRGFVNDVLGRVGGSRIADTMNPYLIVGLRGWSETTETTHVVRGNGFSPVFQSTFQFYTDVPSATALVVEVHHDDSASGRSFMVGRAAVLVSSLRPGIRWMRLLDARGREFIPWSGLLVKTRITHALPSIPPPTISPLGSAALRRRPHLISS